MRELRHGMNDHIVRCTYRGRVRVLPNSKSLKTKGLGREYPQLMPPPKKEALDAV